MSGFSADWLALREPADAAARSANLTTVIVDALGGRPACRVVDLGCGTGSNVRYLSRVLPQAQAWRIVDHDPLLLAVAAERAGRPVESCVADLRSLDAALLADRDLVTASALLDLVSDAWLATFVGHCRQAEAAVLVALNYDGRIECAPFDDDDEFVRNAVNAHQRTDKGFGPALGPDSGARTVALLREAGYDVRSAKSDWVLGGDQAELQRQLIAGWASAAADISPSEAARIDAWLQRRLAHVAAGSSRLIVGHDDVAGCIR